MEVCLASLHPRALSGQIDSLAGLGRALARRGHGVKLVAPFDTSQLLEGSLTSIDSGPRGLVSAAARMAHTLPRIVAAARDADLLHLALPTPAFSWLGDVVQAYVAAPVLISYESHLVRASEALSWRSLRQSWRSWLPLWGVNNGWFARLGSHSCPAYVVSTALQGEELRSLGVPASRIQILPNVVNGDKLWPAQAAWARRELNLPERVPLVGYIGHFNPVKGVDTLAEAFVDLNQRISNVHLALAWSGQGNPRPIRRALERVSGQVSWLGKVDVATFLSAVDVLAAPYHSTAGQGAIPSLILEALQMQRPLVTTRLPLLEEVLQDGQTALLCEAGSVGSLTAQMERLLTDRSLARQMAASQALARRPYLPATLAPQYEELYMKLVDERTEARAEAA